MVLGHRIGFMAEHQCGVGGEQTRGLLADCIPLLEHGVAERDFGITLKRGCDYRSESRRRIDVLCNAFDRCQAHDQERQELRSAQPHLLADHMRKLV